MKKITLASLVQLLADSGRRSQKWTAQLISQVFKGKSHNPNGAEKSKAAKPKASVSRTKAPRPNSLKLDAVKPAPAKSTSAKPAPAKPSAPKPKQLKPKPLKPKPKQLKPKPLKTNPLKSKSQRLKSAKLLPLKHILKTLKKRINSVAILLAAHVKRCSLFYKWLLSVCLSLGLLTGSIYFAIEDLKAYPEQGLKLEQTTQITINAGMSVTKLVQSLEQQGVVTESWKIRYLVKLRPELAQIRTGLYEIFPTDTLESFLQRVLSGKVVTFAVTLVEGKSIKEWQASLESQPRLSLSEAPFLTVLKAHGDDSGLPEGKFYPETYHYHADEPVVELLTRSFVMMQSALNTAWEGRSGDVQVKSAYELLILASIIEKETGQASERPLISAVFNNRLKLGMRLQTDPTVIYGMGERFNGNITRKDLQEATAFNTYKINGLPPTPIAAPSQAALDAAAHPADVDYLYFVSRNDGSHVFSKTLKDHNAAVNQYQRRKKK